MILTMPLKIESLLCEKLYLFSPWRGGSQCALSALDLAIRPLLTFSPRHLPKYWVA